MSEDAKRIPVLVSLAQDGNEKAKEYAAGALRNLASTDDNQIAIVDAGGIQVLMALARNGSTEAKDNGGGDIGILG